MISLVVVVALVASLLMAWSVGANSNSPPFAPAVGANALPTMRAALLIGILAGAGAIIQGGNISETVGTALIDGVQISPLAAAAGLITAALFIVLGVRTGYPIPAAFATTGAMVGVGLGLGGDPAMATYRRIVTFWALVPVFGLTIAFSTATLLRHDRVPEEVGVGLLGGVVGFVVANMTSPLVPSTTGPQGTIAQFVSTSLPLETPQLVGGFDLAMLATSLAFAALGFRTIYRMMQASVDAGIKRFLVGLGSLVAFSSGGSQVGLATGPLEALFETQLQLPGVYLLALGGTGILIGAWTGAPRLLQAVAREYSQLGVRRSIAALVPGFIIAQTAITLGIPISFNNIIISSVIGSGLVEGSAGVSKRKIGFTLAIWLLTLGTAVALGFGLYRVLATVVGA